MWELGEQKASGLSLPGWPQCHQNYLNDSITTSEANASFNRDYRQEYRSTRYLSSAVSSLRLRRARPEVSSGPPAVTHVRPWYHRGRERLLTQHGKQLSNGSVMGVLSNLSWDQGEEWWGKEWSETPKLPSVCHHLPIHTEHPTEPCSHPKFRKTWPSHFLHLPPPRSHLRSP